MLHSGRRDASTLDNLVAFGEHPSPQSVAANLSSLRSIVYNLGPRGDRAIPARVPALQTRVLTANRSCLRLRLNLTVDAADGCTERRHQAMSLCPASSWTTCTAAASPRAPPKASPGARPVSPASLFLGEQEPSKTDLTNEHSKWYHESGQAARAATDSHCSWADRLPSLRSGRYELNRGQLEDHPW
jgi:hypothetical protein